MLRFVRNKDVELATEAFGNPARGTILLAMGATASMVWWPSRLVDALANAEYRVIRFDHRDTGQSTTRPPGDVRYKLNDIVSDLFAIMDAYHVDSVHLVGMSLGGYVSQIAALENPKRVKSLTLIASEPVGGGYEGEGVSPAILAHFAKMAELDWHDRSAVARFLLRIAELSAGSAFPFDEKAVSNRIAVEIGRAVNIQSAFNHSMIEPDIDPGLNASKLRLPVLLIHGSEDPVISVSACEAAQRAIAESRSLVLEGRGHEIADQDIPVIAEAIISHCDAA